MIPIDYKISNVSLHLLVGFFLQLEYTALKERIISENFNFFARA